MSLIPQTPQEIIKAYGDELAAKWGPNVLQDPIANRSDILVRLLSMTALSLADIEQKVEAIIIQQNPDNLEGLALTNYGASRGVPRKTGTRSKAILLVTGQQGAILPSGSELTDRFGSIWETSVDIVLESAGTGCAYSHGVICSKESGNFCLNKDELVYDTSDTPWIYSATNGMMLETGGAEESDEVYRNRIKNIGALAKVRGTADNVLADIYALEGVRFARFSHVNSCVGDGPMFIVYGGAGSQICDTILAKAPLACNLIGTTQCSDCNDIRFQRPCPVLLCIEITMNCECPTSTEEIITSLVLSLATQLSLQTKIKNSDFSNLHPDIDYVGLKIKRPILHSCPEDDPDVPVVIDPLSGEELVFATQDTSGLCSGVSECANEQKPFVSTLRLNPWEYPILVTEGITFSGDCPPVEDNCSPCDEVE